MTHWSFVIAAYAVALLATGALLVSSFAAMRKAERAAEQLKRQQ